MVDVLNPFPLSVELQSFGFGLSVYYHRVRIATLTVPILSLRNGWNRDIPILIISDAAHTKELMDFLGEYSEGNGVCIEIKALHLIGGKRIHWADSILERFSFFVDLPLIKELNDFMAEFKSVDVSNIQDN